MCKSATGRPGTEVDPAVRVYVVLISGTLLGFSGAEGGGGAAKSKRVMLPAMSDGIFCRRSGRSDFAYCVTDGVSSGA